MTRQSAIDQAVRRGFAKQYGSTQWWSHAFRAAMMNCISGLEHKAILIAWDRLISSQSKPMPTPKSAGLQPSFPMNKADHAGGLAIKERA